jgi:hypothetical protein
MDILSKNDGLIVVVATWCILGVMVVILNRLPMWGLPNISYVGASKLIFFFGCFSL